MSKNTNKRQASGMTEAQRAANPGIKSGDREKNAHGVSRFERSHMGGSSKTLTIAESTKEKMENERKHLHWILDSDKGRLLQAKNAGYEHVVDDQGSNIGRTSGKYQMFLMAIPQKWHEDDLKLKRKTAADSLGKTEAGEATVFDGEVKQRTKDSMFT